MRPHRLWITRELGAFLPRAATRCSPVIRCMPLRFAMDLTTDVLRPRTISPVLTPFSPVSDCSSRRRPYPSGQSRRACQNQRLDRHHKLHRSLAPHREVRQARLQHERVNLPCQRAPLLLDRQLTPVPRRRRATVLRPDRCRGAGPRRASSVDVLMGSCRKGSIFSDRAVIRCELLRPAPWFMRGRVLQAIVCCS